MLRKSEGYFLINNSACFQCRKGNLYYTNLGRTNTNYVFMYTNYGEPFSGFDYKTCSIVLCLEKQCPNIADGVHEIPNVDDKGLMFCYATDETDFALTLEKLAI